MMKFLFVNIRNLLIKSNISNNDDTCKEKQDGSKFKNE